jgi:hypothetical protein
VSFHTETCHNLPGQDLRLVGLIEQNLRRNAAQLDGVRGTARQCVWGHADSAAGLLAEHGAFDDVVAAGCTYNTGMYPALFATIAALLADGGRLYLCHARRDLTPSVPNVNQTKRAHKVTGFWRGSRRSKAPPLPVYTPPHPPVYTPPHPQIHPHPQQDQTCIRCAGAHEPRRDSASWPPLRGLDVRRGGRAQGRGAWRRQGGVRVCGPTDQPDGDGGWLTQCGGGWCGGGGAVSRQHHGTVGDVRAAAAAVGLEPLPRRAWLRSAGPGPGEPDPGEVCGGDWGSSGDGGGCGAGDAAGDEADGDNVFLDCQGGAEVEVSVWARARPSV